MAIQTSIGSWLVLATGIFLIGCGDNSENQTVDSNYIPDGKLIYTNNCASCHGEKGDEGTSGAFDLTSMKISRDSIKNIVLQGRNGMPPFEYIISDSIDVEALLDHVEKLNK